MENDAEIQASVRRDYFIMAALTGLISNGCYQVVTEAKDTSGGQIYRAATADEIGLLSVVMAEATLKAAG